MSLLDANKAVKFFQDLQPGDDAKKQLLDKMSEIEGPETEIHDLHDEIDSAAAEAIVRCDLFDDPELGEMNVLMQKKLQREAALYPRSVGDFEI